MMTRKDFEAIASVIASEVSATKLLKSIEAGNRDARARAVTLQSLTYDLAQQFIEGNPRFNHIKFYEACGFLVEWNYPKVWLEEED